MTTPEAIYGNEDILDSREIIARIDWLNDTDDEDEIIELAGLEAFAEEAEEVSDWLYGETFVSDSYFETYAKELASDIGAVDVNAGWPNSCIDWEAAASELQVDYTSYELFGTTYWARA